MNAVSSSATLYWHTLRYLKPVQWYGRLWFKLWRPRLDALKPAPARRAPAVDWKEPASRRSSMLSPGRFCFLNEEHSLPAVAGWNDPAAEKLWLYNLHYFDDLNAMDAGNRVHWHSALLQQWVAENPPTQGIGWEPYPTSLRIVNWVKWSLAGNTLPEACIHSLGMQARWLASRMEWHLLGNHLFANAKALVYAGLFFESAEARYWLSQGLKIIEEQLPEQVLSDGGNFERSTMYHALFLEDLLDLINASAAWPHVVDAREAAKWRSTAARMLSWLEAMTHPDGQIAHFNDAALGIAPDVEALCAYACRVGVVVPKQRMGELPTLLALRASGYVRLAGSNAVAILDVAPVGPDYLPGHAHADTLSFELSVHGQRVVVNGGTSRYGSGPERLRERGTSAHSTVEIAGQDSSEVWSGFRVARRARPFGLQIHEGQEGLRVSCSHDGFCRLPQKPVHHREWYMCGSGLKVSDSVFPGAHVSVARYIMHPDVEVLAEGRNVFQLSALKGQKARVEIIEGTARIENAQYAPEFGKVFPTRCLAVELIEGKAETAWTWN